MRNQEKIKEPPCPLDERGYRACLAFVDGKLTYYVNQKVKADLLWSCWFNYAESPYYADPSLNNDFYPNLTSQQNWIPYSETIIIKDEDVAQMRKNHPTGYRHLPGRLDFYVTKSEFAEAYYALQKLGRRQGTGQIRKVRIFSRIDVVLLSNAEFGNRFRE